MPHQEESLFPTFHLQSADVIDFYVLNNLALMCRDSFYFLLLPTLCLYHTSIMSLNRCFRDVKSIKATTVLTIEGLACEIDDTEPVWLGPALLTEFVELVKRHVSTH